MQKKNVVPFLLSLAVLGAGTLALRDNSLNRFAFRGVEGESTEGSGGGGNALGKLDWHWYDIKFRLRKPEHARGVLVARIDDASLERFGRWPWNRSIYGEILDYLYELGAEVVAFDAVFTEPEFQERYLKVYMQAQGAGRPESLQTQLKLDEPALSLLAKELPGIGDQIFASSVLKYPKTVLGYFWQGRDACRLYDPADPAHQGKETLTREAAAAAGLLHVESLVDNLSYLAKEGITTEGFKAFDGKQELAPLMGFCPTVNRGNITANAKHQGFFSAISDEDGLFRRIPLVFGLVSDFVPKANRDFLPPEWFTRSTFFPSLALEAVATAWDSPGVKVEMKNDRHGKPAIAAIEIARKGAPPVRVPTLDDGSVLINFYGTQKAHERPIGEFSLANISAVSDPEFRKRYDLDLAKPLKDQIIFIGPTALGVYDLRPNPVQGDAAGVMLHATMAARLLAGAGESLAMRFASLPAMLGVLWGLGLLIAALMIRLRALQGLLSTLGVIGAFLAVDLWVFNRHNLALDAMSVTTVLAAVFLSIFAYKYFTEERERAFVKGAFEKYVSPDLVGQILQDPRKLNLGGQKKELSVLFSDIRGFTKFSEKMGASDLAKFLNEYLSPMTDVIQENKGTIDKYMGDAIMAIFGAPIEYERHAERAVDASLAMLAKLNELQVGWQARDLPLVDIGIGINTGDMSVGNMGSSRIFSYTVMGDSVNLGSRLEGINKEYGTNLIVSEYTRKHLGPQYVVRELDRVKVKGKNKPVTIFEVLGKGELGERAALARRFEEGLQLYYTAKFTEAREVFAGQADRDKTSAIYVERCDLWLATPPPADWDGSWTMTTK